MWHISIFNIFLFPNIYLPYFFNYVFQKILHNRKSKTRYVYHWTVTYYGRQNINLYSNVPKKKKSIDSKETNNSLKFKNGPGTFIVLPYFFILSLMRTSSLLFTHYHFTATKSYTYLTVLQSNPKYPRIEHFKLDSKLVTWGLFPLHH